jgi:hypothetical protein
MQHGRLEFDRPAPQGSKMPHLRRYELGVDGRFAIHLGLAPATKTSKGL